VPAATVALSHPATTCCGSIVTGREGIFVGEFPHVVTSADPRNVERVALREGHGRVSSRVEGPDDGRGLGSCLVPAAVAAAVPLDVDSEAAGEKKRADDVDDLHGACAIAWRQFLTLPLGCYEAAVITACTVARIFSPLPHSRIQGFRVYTAQKIKFVEALLKKTWETKNR
jgi:hypothetical protein